MTSGIQAIDAALGRVYGDQAAHRFNGQAPAPLEQVTINRCEEHWHYVSYGLSQLHDDDSSHNDEDYVAAGYDEADPAQSGWGFELTFRLAANGDDPPTWPIGLLMWLAGYVKETRNPFAPHHTMDMKASADPETPDASMTAIVTCLDPRLEAIQTPHGAVRFLQVVGITHDELEATRAWNAEAFLELLTERHPLGVSDLTRSSILEDAETQARVGAGIERDGSSQAACYTQLHWARTSNCSEAQLDLTPLGAVTVRRLLAGRTAHGRDFHLFAETQGVVFTRGDTPGFEEPSVAVLQVTVDDALAAEMIKALEPTPGDHTWDRLPGFVVRVLNDGAVPGSDS